MEQNQTDIETLEQTTSLTPEAKIQVGRLFSGLLKLICFSQALQQEVLDDFDKDAPDYGSIFESSCLILEYASHIEEPEEVFEEALHYFEGTRVSLTA